MVMSRRKGHMTWPGKMREACTHSAVRAHSRLTAALRAGSEEQCRELKECRNSAFRCQLFFHFYSYEAETYPVRAAMSSCLVLGLPFTPRWMARILSREMGFDWRSAAVYPMDTRALPAGAAPLRAAPIKDEGVDTWK